MKRPEYLARFVLDFRKEFGYSTRMNTIAKVFATIVWLAAAIAFCAAIAGATPVRHHISPAANPVFAVSGGTPQEQVRIARLEEKLNFSQVTMVSDWSVTILNSLDWDYYLRMYGLENQTVSAFTLPHQRHTFISQDYIAQNNDQRVQHTLAHEAGHLICECESEQKANEIADVLVSKK